jgi:hypothetical protein
MDDFTYICFDEDNGEPIYWHTFKKQNPSWKKASFARVAAAMDKDGVYRHKGWTMRFVTCEDCGEAKASVYYTGGMMGSWVCQGCHPDDEED